VTWLRLYHRPSVDLWLIGSRAIDSLDAANICSSKDSTPEISRLESRVTVVLKVHWYYSSRRKGSEWTESLRRICETLEKGYFNSPASMSLNREKREG
jgi:hypothetical protein